MWHNVNMPDDLELMVEGIRNGSLIDVTNGSYDREIGKHICGTGWVIYHRTAKKYLKGSFVESSNLASNYQGELLGMLAVHLFLLAIKEHYNLGGDNNKIYCKNKGAIFAF